MGGLTIYTAPVGSGGDSQDVFSKTLQEIHQLASEKSTLELSRDEIEKVIDKRVTECAKQMYQGILSQIKAFKIRMVALGAQEDGEKLILKINSTQTLTLSGLGDTATSRGISDNYSYITCERKEDGNIHVTLGGAANQSGRVYYQIMKFGADGMPVKEVTASQMLDYQDIVNWYKELLSNMEDIKSAKKLSLEIKEG